MTNDAAPITLGEVRKGASLADRVTALEQAAQTEPLEGSTEQTSGPGTADLAERLDRHRSDIDELKRRYNELARYVRQQLEGGGQ